MVDEVWYPKGSKIFLREGKLMRGTRWGVHAYLVDGTRGLTERVVDMLQSEKEEEPVEINMFKVGERSEVEKEEEGKIQVYCHKVFQEYDQVVLSKQVPKDPHPWKVW